MNNTDYVRRVVAIQNRIALMFPEPAGDWDSNQYEWEDMYRRRDRATRRIFELPKRWREMKP
jgi:hypothetical protein